MDITLYKGTDSELCKSCYRNDKNTKSNPWQQSYFKVPMEDNGKCEYYSEV